MAAVDMRMPSTWLEPFRQLDPGLRGQLVRAMALLAFTGALLVSMAAFAVSLLVRYDGHPMSQVWIMAVTLCIYVFLFLQCIWRSWPFYTDLARLSYGLLLAAVTAAHVGPHAAVLALHLSTVYAAAYLGYALALHRLRAGTERAIGRPVPYPGPKAEAEARSTTRVIAATTLLATAISLAIEAVIFGNKTKMVDELVTVVFLSSMGCMYAPVLNVFVANDLMGGALLEGWMMCLLLACVLLSFFLYIFMAVSPSMVAGAVAPALCVWLLMMALVTFLAYNFAVCIAYLHTAAAAAAAAVGNEIVDQHGQK